MKLGWKLNFYHVAKRENKQENQGQNERAGLTEIKAEISIKLSMTQSCHMRG